MNLRVYERRKTKLQSIAAETHTEQEECTSGFYAIYNIDSPLRYYASKKTLCQVVSTSRASRHEL